MLKTKLTPENTSITQESIDMNEQAVPQNMPVMESEETQFADLSQPKQEVPEQQQQKGPGDPVYDLWKGLSDRKAYTKSFDDFKAKYSNQTEIDGLFNKMVEKKAYSKSKDEFYTKYFPNLKKNETLSQGQQKPVQAGTAATSQSESTSTSPIQAQAQIQVQPKDQATNQVTNQIPGQQTTQVEPEPLSNKNNIAPFSQSGPDYENDAMNIAYKLNDINKGGYLQGFANIISDKEFDANTSTSIIKEGSALKQKLKDKGFNNEQILKLSNDAAYLKDKKLRYFASRLIEGNDLIHYDNLISSLKVEDIFNSDPETQAKLKQNFNQHRIGTSGDLGQEQINFVDAAPAYIGLIKPIDENQLNKSLDNLGWYLKGANKIISESGGANEENKEKAKSELNSSAASYVYTYVNPDYAKKYIADRMGGSLELKDPIYVPDPNGQKDIITGKPIMTEVTSVDFEKDPDIDKYNLASIKAKLDPKNPVDEMVLDIYRKSIAIGDAVKSVDYDQEYKVSDNRLENIAVAYYATTDPNIKATIDSFKDENGTVYSLPSNLVGQLVDNFTTDPNVKDSKDFKKLLLDRDSRIAQKNLYDRYPQYARDKVSSKIAQWREDHGYNNFFYNSPSMANIDESVKLMKEDGTLSDKDVDFYNSKIRSAFYKPETSDFISGIGKGVLGTLKGGYKTAKSIFAKTPTGVLLQGTDIGHNILSDEAERVRMINDEVIPKLAPNSTNAIFGGMGDFTGMAVGLAMGTAELKALGFATEAAETTNLFRAFYGNNYYNARKLHPKDNMNDIGLSYASAVGNTFIDMFALKFIPVNKATQAITKQFKLDANAILNQAATGAITESAAKESLLKLSSQWVKSTVGHSIKSGAALTGLGAMHDMFGKLLGENNKSFKEIGLSAADNLLPNALSSVVVSGFAALKPGKKKINAKNAWDIAKHPEFYMDRIKKMSDNGVDPEKVNDIKSNAEIIIETKKHLDDPEFKDLTLEQKQKYLHLDLQQKVYERKATSTVDKSIAEKYSKKSKEFQEQKDAILNNNDKATEFKEGEEVSKDEINEIKPSEEIAPKENERLSIVDKDNNKKVLIFSGGKWNELVAGHIIRPLSDESQKLASDQFAEKQKTYDQENIAGVPSQIGVGEEPVTTKPIEGTGAETPTTGGVLQTPGAEGEVKTTGEEVTTKTKEGEPIRTEAGATMEIAPGAAKEQKVEAGVPAGAEPVSGGGAEAAPTVLEPKEGDVVELKPQVKGGLPRRMIFKEGEWKQEVGGKTTTVGEPVKAKAQAEFLKQKGAEAPVTEAAKQEAKPTEEVPEQKQAFVQIDKNVYSDGKNKKYIVPTSSSESSGTHIEVDESTYKEWKKIDDQEKSRAERIKKSPLNQERKNADLKANAMSAAAEKRKVLGTQTANERSKAKEATNKIQLGDNVNINGIEYTVQGFPYGKIKLSTKGEGTEGTITVDKNSDIIKKMADEKKAAAPKIEPKGTLISDVNAYIKEPAKETKPTAEAPKTETKPEAGSVGVGKTKPEAPKQEKPTEPTKEVETPEQIKIKEKTKNKLLNFANKHVVQPVVKFSRKLFVADPTESIVDEMNSMGGVNINVNLNEVIKKKGKLNTRSFKRKGVVLKPNVVSVTDFNGKPILLTISDELTTGEIVNPITGQVLGNLRGGIGFNYSKGNTEFAWAYTSEKAASDVLNAAKEMYNKNPELYPDGIVPVAVVKMGKSAMVSNEAVIRQVIQNLTDPKIPEKNKQKAFEVLKGDIKNQLDVVDARISKAKSEGKAPTASDEATIRGYKDVLNLIDNSKNFDDLLNNVNKLNIGTRPLLIARFTSGDPNIVPAENRMSIDKPATIALMEGLPKSEYKRINLGHLVNNLVDPSLADVPDKHIISFVGIDARADAPVKSKTHPNYPYALKGKGLGVLENTVHVADVMPSAQGNIINKLITAEESGKPVTNEQVISAGLPAGMNNKIFRNKPLSERTSDYNKLVGYLQLAFPNTHFFTDPKTWEAVLDSKDVKKYLKDGEVVYGLTKDGHIYLNPNYDSLNTPIHEAGHLHIDFLETTNPELFNKGISLVEGTDAHKEAIKEYGEDGIAARKEALATLIGNKGETITDAAMKSKFKEWLVAVYKYIQSKFPSLKSLTPEQIADLTLDQFVNGSLRDILGAKEVEAPKGKEKAQVEQPKFSKEAPEAQKLAEMKEIVKDLVEDKHSLSEIKDIVTRGINDKSEATIKLIEDAHAEVTKAGGAEVPPTEKAKTETAGEEPEMTKVANAINDAFVEGRFGTETLDNIMSNLQDTSTVDLYNKIKEQIKSGSLKPVEVREKVLTQKGGTEADQAALIYDLADLKSKESSLMDQLINATDPKEQASLAKDILDVQTQMQENALANRLIGRSASTIFRLRQMIVNREMDMASMEKQYMASKGIKELSPEQQKEVKAAYNKIKELSAKLKKAQAEIDALTVDKDRLKAENERLSKLKEQAKKKEKEDRAKKVSDKISASQDRISKIKQNMKNLRGGLKSGVDPRIALYVGEIAAEKFYQGAVKFADLVTAVHEEIKDVFTDWTEDDVKRHLLPNIKPEYFDAEKDYSKSEKDLREKIEEYKKIQSEYAKTIYEWNKDRRSDLNEKKSWGEKLADNIYAWQRFAVLSYPSTMVKLAAVVGHNLILKPFRLGLQKVIAKVGGAMSKDFAGKMGVYGDPSLKAMGKYYSEFIRNFSLANLKEQFSGIDTKEILYGDKFMFDEWSAGKGLLEMPGRAHGYIKSFVKGPEFAFAHEMITTQYINRMAEASQKLENERNRIKNEVFGSERSLARAIDDLPNELYDKISDLTGENNSVGMAGAYNENGGNISKQMEDIIINEKTKNLKEEYDNYDVTNEDNLLKINKLALEHGKDAILMGDNAVVDKFRELTKGSGFWSTFLKTEAPIVKIPLNFINRALLTKYGLFQALTGKSWGTKGTQHPSVAKLIYKGTEGLTDAQGQVLSKVIQYGTMGAALFTLGYMNRKNVKVNDDGSIDINGFHISKNLVHVPEFESFFSGVETAQKYNDEDLNWIEAFVSSDIDILKKNPFMNLLEYGLIGGTIKAMTDKKMKDENKLKIIEDAASNKLINLAVPGFVKQSAQWLDTKEGKGMHPMGEPVKRRPDQDANWGTRFIQALELSIPGLRSMVPEVPELYSEKDIKEDKTLSQLNDAGIELPDISRRKFKVLTDDKHPNGDMTAEEKEKFVSKLKSNYNTMLQSMLNSKWKGTDQTTGQVVYAMGTELGKFKGDIKINTTELQEMTNDMFNKAWNKTYEEMGFEKAPTTQYSWKKIGAEAFSNDELNKNSLLKMYKGMNVDFKEIPSVDDLETIKPLTKEEYNTFQQVYKNKVIDKLEKLADTEFVQKEKDIETGKYKAIEGTEQTVVGELAKTYDEGEKKKKTVLQQKVDAIMSGSVNETLEELGFKKPSKSWSEK